MGLRLRYLGCEGVLVRGSGQAVLIDGLFGAEAAPFGMPPDADLDALRHAKPPYAGVDVVLATHNHEDHFAPAAVASYLEASPTTRFVSTPQAVEQLLAAAGPSVADRVHAVVPREGERQIMDVNGIRVESFGLSHGKVNYADVEQLGLIVRLGGMSLMHLGDGIIDEKSMRAAGVLDETIDVGVLPFWFLTYPFGKRLVQRGFRPRALFAVHVRVAERDEIVREIESWIVATPLIEPLARYRVDEDARVIRVHDDEEE
ncbi:MAG TPA: MBL fold metallo-hydrolase [Candidatus Krumholzibacteria bacterium]|nr:MBL fold metallo-hydrolase [Candidatus Krumholzibacteria bacterium]